MVWLISAVTDNCLGHIKESNETSRRRPVVIINNYPAKSRGISPDT